MAETDDVLKAGRDLAERVEKAFHDLEDERESNRTLKLELGKLQNERDALKQQLDARYIPLSVLCTSDSICTDRCRLSARIWRRPRRILDPLHPRPTTANSFDN